MSSTASGTDLAGLDISDLTLWRDGPPHQVFEQLRREAPLHWSELSDFEHERGFWSVVRYADIAEVGRDHETFSSKRSIILVDKLSWDPEVPDPIDVGEHMLITQDPPRHDHLKTLVQSAFTPRRALEHTERMREIINLVYDRALADHADGRVDLVQDVGVYVPSMVIGDMLGVPREDADRLVDWTNRTTAFEDPRLVPDLGDVWQALQEFIPYVNEMLEERKERPTDDLTTAFLEAEVDGERLSHEEVLMFFFLLMVAGNDSTRAVFTSGMKNLLDDPEQMQLVRSGSVPLDQVVEEFVRYNPAFAYMRRTATRDTEVAGQAVKAGDKLALWYVSGNRDDSVFEDPHRFDVRRAPNPHQGFGGGGKHFCLGAGLARLELKLWLEETLRRFPDIRLDGASERLSSTFLNQYQAIPVALAG
ncbi:MAG TPA: cytochrome P450 [Solirubrobacteraceae bacterium]|jgi:cytochrome P450|nr:cytochrome P450 [Solirubrobacteraceae bacterium]